MWGNNILNKKTERNKNKGSGTERKQRWTNSRQRRKK